MIDRDNLVVPPQFGPKILIAPTWSGDGEVFKLWTVRLLSMTLLVPQKHDPDYRLDSQPDWLPIQIHIPSFDGSPGIRATFDTGELFTLMQA